MYKKLTKTVLSLALVGLLLPMVGCKYKKGGYHGGSYTDVAFGMDWLPSFGGYDIWDEYEETVVYEEDVFVSTSDSYYYEDDIYYTDDYYYDDGYYDDEYYDDGGYYWDDDWKKKRRGRRK